MLMRNNFKNRIDLLMLPNTTEGQQTLEKLKSFWFVFETVGLLVECNSLC